MIGTSSLLRVPPDPPAKQAWSITLYDAETRRLIQNAQQIADRSSRNDLVKNADGSIDLHFGRRAHWLREELDSDRARRGAVHALTALWPARAISRRELTLARHRICQVTTHQFESGPSEHSAVRSERAFPVKLTPNGSLFDNYTAILS